MIRVQNLTKRYGRKTAVDNLSFEVDAGEIVGFLGPNGAGKTTTMRILSCYLPASGGRATVAGYDVFSESLAVRSRLGYLPENVPLYMDMRVREYLKYRARLKGLSGGELSRRVDEVIEDCGLRDVRRSMISRLSKGFRQRVGLADALVHNPRLLILDEPTIGLDPNQIRHIRSLIKNLAEKHTVLLCSHILSEVEMICERVLIIKEGRIAATGAPAELSRVLRDGLELTVEARGDKAAIQACLAGMDAVEAVDCEAGEEWSRFTCTCKPGSDPREEVFVAFAEQRWRLRELRSQKRNLEDVFVAVTADDNSAPKGEEPPVPVADVVVDDAAGEAVVEKPPDVRIGQPLDENERPVENGPNE